MKLNREIAILILLLVSCVLLWFLKTYLENNLYTKSSQLRQTEQLINSYKKVNMRLNEELLYSESYTKIASEAASEGYVPATFVTP